MNGTSSRLARDATVVLAAVTLSGGTAYAVATAAEDRDQPAAATRTNAEQAADTARGALSLQEIVRRARGAVVEIATTGSGGDEQPFGVPREQRGQGSGFVYDDEGHIVTNAHVVQGADEVVVTFADGREVRARVVGSDPSTDLAVLKIEEDELDVSPLRLARSSDVRVGDPVVAIGSPFGLEGSVTSGIVSATGRTIQAPNDFAIDDAIQTDAAINQGNSGGPLLDGQGRVIGVNSQIESRSGGNDGVGYAVPSDTVRDVVAEIIESGHVEHAYLGVAVEDAPDDRGARIADVRAGTPAARAGVREGDVVTSVDGERVRSGDDLRAAVDEREPGDTVELELRRGGQTRTLDVELGERPASATS